MLSGQRVDEGGHRDRHDAEAEGEDGEFGGHGAGEGTEVRRP